jgi:hypothetical protein
VGSDHRHERKEDKHMMALNLIFALLAAAAVATVMGLGFFVGAGRLERRGASVEELPRRRERELEAA